jgi:hypothetical protein
MSGEDAPRPCLENLIVPEIKTNKQVIRARLLTRAASSVTAIASVRSLETSLNGAWTWWCDTPSSSSSSPPSHTNIIGHTTPGTRRVHLLQAAHGLQEKVRQVTQEDRSPKFATRKVLVVLRCYKLARVEPRGSLDDGQKGASLRYRRLRGRFVVHAELSKHYYLTD